jgi:hypothetical protein
MKSVRNIIVTKCSFIGGGLVFKNPLNIERYEWDIITMIHNRVTPLEIEDMWKQTHYYLIKENNDEINER